MVAAVRRGCSQRAVARHFHVALRTVQHWLRRAGDEALGAVDWSSRRRTPRRRPKQTDPALERRVCFLRKELARSALGFVGARRFTMLCAQRVLAPSGPVFGRSTGFSDAMAYSTARYVYADRPPRVAGICRALRSLKESWIVSMSLKICAWKDAASSKSLPHGRCGDLPSVPGRHWWPQPTACSAPWNYFGANMDCQPSPSLITTSVSKAGTTIPMSSDESCASVFPSASHRFLLRHWKAASKPPSKTSTASANERSGSGFIMKLWRPSARFPIALPRLTPRVWIVFSIPNTIPRVALSHLSGRSICNASHAVESSTSVAPTSLGRSNFWAIAFPWIHSGLIGSPAAKSTWSGTRSTAFASAVALLTTNPSSPHSRTNFPNAISTPAHGTNIP